MATLSPHTTLVLGFLNAIAGTARPAGDHFPGIFHQKRFTAMPGGKRDRIVWQSITFSTRNGMPDAAEVDAMFARAQRSVRCFVDRADGTILYAGGWNSPAKWKTGPATEFGPGEGQAYAEFTRDNGWGYQGDRKAWEDKKSA